MFRRLRQRIRDMSTLSQLCTGARNHALQAGEKEPGAEHFLLAAIALPEGSARRVFERLKADPGEFGAAIARQYREALHCVGAAAAWMDTDVGGLELELELEPAATDRSLYTAKPSGQAVLQGLVVERTSDEDAPLLGAHVVAVIAGMERGVAVRSLRAMGVDRHALRAAAREEIMRAAA